MDYIIPIITRASDKTRQNTALHLIVVFVLLITGAFLLLYRSIRKSLPATDRNKLAVLPIDGWQGWIIMGIGALILLFVLFRSRMLLNLATGKLLRALELGMLLLFAIFTLIHGIYTPAALYGLVCILILYSFFQDLTGQKPPEVFIDKRGITIPTDRLHKKLDWSEVNNILLRYDVLTIDCTDNRFFQWNISKTSIRNLDGFEEFCSIQIEQAKPHRIKNDW